MLSKFLIASTVAILLLFFAFVTATTTTTIRADEIIVPKTLRAPLDVWEHTFQLRRAYDDILPGSSGDDRANARRYVFLDPISFSRNSSSSEDRQHNDQADSHDPFWSGRAVEDPTLFLQFDAKVVLDHDGNTDYETHKDNNPLQSIQVLLNREAWGTGCFRAVIRDLDKNNQVISESPIKCPAMSSRGNYVKLPLPDEDLIKRAWNNNGMSFWRVTVEFERPEVTTFSYINPDGFAKDLLQSHEKYDITPDNASMGFKFMFQVDEKEEAVEIWAFRKPPVPDFRLSFYADRKPIFSESINSIGLTAHAYGVQHQIEEEDFESFSGKEVAMFATFVEPRREFRANVHVEDFSRQISDALLGASATNKEGQNYREYIMHVPSDEVIVGSDAKKNVEFIFRYYPSSGFVGFYVNFPFPAKNALVSFWILESKESQKRVHLFMRESDAVVPHAVNDHGHHLLYGWDDALPVVGAADGQKKFHHVLENPFDLEVQFDRIPENQLMEEEQHQHVKLSALLETWIHNSGGDVQKVDLDYLNAIHHSHAKPHPLKVNRAVPKWVEETHNSDIRKHAIVVVPMYNIFSSSVAMHSGWGQLIAAHSKQLEEYLVKERLHPESVEFMYLTLASLSHVYDGSHNFRPLFHLFEQSAINLPPLYHTEELNLFSFSDSFSFERNRMIGMWNAEYEVISQLESKLRREISREMYFFHRSQVEARAINGTNGEMQLVPVVDLAPHSDVPSAQVRFDEEDGNVILVALHDLKAGDDVTLNYGTLKRVIDETETTVSKTDIGFLLQHGTVPSYASRSCGFVVKNQKGEDRIFALFWGHPNSMEDYLRYIRNGNKFDDELTQEEVEASKNYINTNVNTDFSDAVHQAFLEILEKKLASLPSEIPDVSDEKLVEREKEKMRTHESKHHHKHHHSRHPAHKERSLEKLRASFDAARDSARKLLANEKVTLEYFISYLKKEGAKEQ